jgi:hypothetical protein
VSASQAEEAGQLAVQDPGPVVGGPDHGGVAGAGAGAVHVVGQVRGDEHEPGQAAGRQVGVQDAGPFQLVGQVGSVDVAVAAVTGDALGAA